MFFVDVAWVAVDGAVGCQLQRESDYSDSGCTTVSAPDDSLLFTATPTVETIASYEETAAFRVRSVSATGDAVTECSEPESVRTPRGNVQ